MRNEELDVALPKIRPELDPGFVPAILWDAAYRRLCAANAHARELTLAIGRSDGTVFHHRLPLPAPEARADGLVRRAAERLLKFLLWSRGGSRVWIAGDDALAGHLAATYRVGGARAFDAEMVGERIFQETLRIEAVARDNLPPPLDRALALGRHLEGCRIGFDLGGSDRKCAAVIDGRVVFSEEVKWDPYFQADPTYHYTGICDSLRRAAAALPRVDAIGGSAAGVYVNNQVRLASLFRGVSAADFASHVRDMFLRIRAEWGGVPFEIVNDGEVTALAGAMALNDNGVLGISLGTSQAAGYCDPAGHITAWLNELAFAPVDWRPGAPADEWSGDRGCGVQYFSQQAVARLLPAAGIAVAADMPLPERLELLQAAMERGDAAAARVYTTIGAYLGYAIAWYAEFYAFKHLLLLGRVMSGAGGQAIIATAERVLAAEFPALRERIRIAMPDEKMKRHGQAIAAASLPDCGPGRRADATAAMEKEHPA
jgi:predicted NBD/HSP70 family sugar kinase